MARTSKGRNRTETLVVHHGGESCDIVIRPAALVVRDQIEVQRLEGAEQSEFLVGILSRFLVSWDVLDDDDQPIPVTEEALAAEEGDFLLAIWSAIAAVRSAEGKASQNGSSTGSGRVPSGIR